MRRGGYGPQRPRREPRSCNANHPYRRRDAPAAAAPAPAAAAPPPPVPPAPAAIQAEANGAPQHQPAAAVEPPAAPAPVAAAAVGVGRRRCPRRGCNNNHPYRSRDAPPAAAPPAAPAPVAAAAAGAGRRRGSHRRCNDSHPFRSRGEGNVGQQANAAVPDVEAALVHGVPAVAPPAAQDVGGRRRQPQENDEPNNEEQHRPHAEAENPIGDAQGENADDPPPPPYELHANDEKVEMEGKFDESSDEDVCAICYEAPPDAVLSCGHAKFCIECIEALHQRRCPMCRRDTESVQQYREQDPPDADAPVVGGDRCLACGRRPPLRPAVYGTCGHWPLCQACALHVPAA